MDIHFLFLMKEYSNEFINDGENKKNMNNKCLLNKKPKYWKIKNISFRT